MVDILNLLKNSSSLIPMKWVVAVVIFFIGAIVAKIASKLIEKLLQELEVNSMIHKATKRRVDIDVIVSKIVLYTIYLISFVLALNEAGITNMILYFVVGFVILVILVTFFLGAKDFVPNLFAGLFIIKKRALDVGDYIRCGDIKGIIEEAGLIETKLRTEKGEHVFIPNSALIRKELVVKRLDKPEHIVIDKGSMAIAASKARTGKRHG